jgi:hypothetical protein
MFNSFPAPARRVLLPMGDATSANMTPEGVKLFDAAFYWALDRAVPPRFNAPTIDANAVTISWTGAGTLEQADSVLGPWSDAPDQSNPQTVPTTVPARFYRVRE